MRRLDYRWLVAFGGAFVFLFLVGQANHYLASTPLLGVSLYLFLLGLPVAFAALRLSLGQGLAATFATALLAEAGLPFAPGMIVLPAVACLCITHALRVNFNRLNASSAIVVALAINLVLMLALTAATAPEWGQSWDRILVDFALSQVAVGLLTGWFFTAQIALQRMFGFNLETELREAP
jgi:hypothetical protein